MAVSMQKKKKVLICAALPYVNNEPHLGHLISTMLPADACSRFLKRLGHSVFFFSGNDVYGTPLIIESIKTGETPEKLMQTYRKVHQQMYKFFNIDFSCFGSTHWKKHRHFVLQKTKDMLQKKLIVWQELNNYTCAKHGVVNGRMIYQKCLDCEKVVEEEEWNNTHEKHLTKEFCALCDAGLKKTPGKHLVLKCKKSATKKLFSRVKINISPSEQKKMFENTSDKCITRHMKWGVRYNKDLVLYVWFEALLSYQSMTNSRWTTSDTILMFMGKDNVYFHTSLMSNLALKRLPSQIVVGNFLNLGGERFSKSKRIGISLSEASKHFTSDAWRFYLFYIKNHSRDSEFDWQHMSTIIQKVFVNKVCNAFQRTLKLLCKSNQILWIKENDMFDESANFVQQMHSCNTSEGFKEMLLLFDKFNAMWQSLTLWSEKRWTQDQMNTVFSWLSLLTESIEPFLPDTHKKLRKLLPHREKEYLINLRKLTLRKPILKGDQL